MKACEIILLWSNYSGPEVSLAKSAQLPGEGVKTKSDIKEESGSSLLLSKASDKLDSYEEGRKVDWT